MSDTTTPTAEPEAERPRDPVRRFNLLPGSGPGLLTEAMKSDAVSADAEAPSTDPKED